VLDALLQDSLLDYYKPTSYSVHSFVSPVYTCVVSIVVIVSCIFNKSELKFVHELVNCYAELKV